MKAGTVNFLETGDGLTRVLVYNDGKVEALRRFFSVYLPEVLLLDKVDGFGGSNSLAIIPEKAVLPQDFGLPPETAVIVSSGEYQQLRQLAALPVRVITCGLGLRDTVTFSSRQEKSGVISLLRALEGVDRNVIEPLDIPFQISDRVPDYPVLAAAAARLYLYGLPENSENFQ